MTDDERRPYFALVERWQALAIEARQIAEQRRPNDNPAYWYGMAETFAAASIALRYQLEFDAENDGSEKGSP